MIARAIESKSSQGALLYTRVFSDPQANIGTRTFQAEYDAAVLAAWRSSSFNPAPTVWDLSLERGVPAELFRIRPADHYDFQWRPDPTSPSDEIAGDIALIHRHYELLASSPSAPSGTGGVIIATGSCDLSFERAHGRWSIFRWVDHVDPTVGVNPESVTARSFTFWRLESLPG